MSYDHIVKGHVAKIKTPTLWPLLIRFQTTEADWPTECGDGMQRMYYGRYCLYDPHKGEIHIYVGRVFGGSGWWPEVGFGEYETLYGKFDTTDGYFKVKVPMGGLPLEPCARAVSRFLTDGGSVTKRGVRYTCDPNKLLHNGPMLDGLGCAIYDHDIKAFVWAAVSGNAFEDGGVYGSRFIGVGGELWALMGGVQPINGKYSKYLWRLVTVQSEPPSFFGTKRYLEQWTPDGLGLSYNNWETPLYEHTFGWQAIPGTDPPEPDYSKPQKYWAYHASPAYTTDDGEWTIRELVYYTGTFGSPWSATFLYSNGRTGEAPHFQSSSGLIRYRAARVHNWPLGLGMELYDRYTLQPSDVHPDCDVFSVLAQTADRALVYATDHATWTQHIYFVMNKISGSIEHLHNWNHSGYSHLDPPTSGAFLSGQAVLWTFDNVNQKLAAFLPETDEFRQYRHWRDTYKHNVTPTGSVDGQLGWTNSYYISYFVADYVHRGDLCFIAQKEDFYMSVAECQAEDFTIGCADGFLRAKGKFKIESLSAREPIVGAMVTVDLWVGPRGGDPDYEDTLTRYTDDAGWVEFNSPCLERTSSRDFVFRFTVTDVVCPELLWVKYGNICDDAEQVFEGLPGWWCNTDEFPLAPDPAQLGSGFPFQGQVGGKWYHIMVAVVAEHDLGCVEYRFECEDDPSLNSAWRNVNNASGTFPDGRSQVGRPHEYWAEVPGGGAPYNGYKWRVQYRACDCDGYEGGTPSNWTPIQNP